MTSVADPPTQQAPPAPQTPEIVPFVPQPWRPGALEPPPAPHDVRTWVDPAPPAPWMAPLAPPLGGPEEFRAWLAGLRPEEVCGRQHKSTQCPLAQYLRSRLGSQSQPYVTTRYYHLAGQPHTLPRWASLFVIAVDLPGRAVHRSSAITASRALQALDLALSEDAQQTRTGL